jgi:aspartyl-tRNA(Asn)/glutamyl-tRNA(Gln) amidotransferase subunit A
MKDLTACSIQEARTALDTKQCTALELAEAHLAHIEKEDPSIHAFLEVYDDVREQARKADERIQAGSTSLLTGIPIALKDNILKKGKRASSGSKMLEGYVASYDSTVVEKLSSAGAVFVGRTNMDEFALGSSTENSAFGPTKNPHDITRVPGGTSGGSAAAVSARMVLGALGSDTGGSIRQPAALCGVVGLKPTYGRVSRFGLMAAASSLDQIGPLARSVDDAEALFSVIRGHDQKDSTSFPQGTYIERTLKKRIGVPRSFLEQGVDRDVLARFEESLAALIREGYEVVDVEVPRLNASLAAYYIVNPAEVSTNLARYDGVRYGFSKESPSVLETYMQTRGEGFGKEARRRLLVGAFVLSAGYADAYYRKAEAVRTLLRDDFNAVFEQVDVIATPTTPAPAFKLGEKEDPLAMYAADIFTVPVNLAGVPAISVPAGTLDRDGVALPVGMQYIAAHGQEDTLFTVARALEKASL